MAFSIAGGRATPRVSRVSGIKKIYILVGSRERAVYSYTWRIWWSGSSFYLKARDAAFADFKVSLHGPDAFHREAGFIVGKDQTATSSSETRTIESGRFLGTRFPGRKLGEGVTHVVTLRFGSELFVEGVPSAPVTHVSDNPSTAAGITAAPGPGRVTDVHLYLSKDAPYFHAEEQARAANALLGPLENNQREFLTGVIQQREVNRNPPPSDLMGPPPIDEEDRVRGFGGVIDPTGFLWIAEQWLSRKTLLEHRRTSGNLESR
jgi:hypothetical protein